MKRLWKENLINVKLKDIRQNERRPDGNYDLRRDSKAAWPSPAPA